MHAALEPADFSATSLSFVRRMRRRRGLRLVTVVLGAGLLAGAVLASTASAATPCDSATHPEQCAWLEPAALPPFVQDAIAAKGGVIGAGTALVLTSGDPLDPDSEISNDVNQAGCGSNPDGWETYDCVQMASFVPPQDSVVLALSSEWFEWYQTIFTDWMTISGAGVATVDVSINSWIDNKVDIIPYGPWETGVVLLTSLSAQKMVDFRVADSGDHIYDTAIVVVPASWFSGQDVSGNDPTLLCGDGKIEPGEECDDGNLVADDDCSNLCLGTQAPPPTPPASSTCGNLVYTWPTGTTAPYTCGADLCGGYRCVIGNTISPACYTAGQCAAACGGSCVDVQTAQLDCSTMCAVQPPVSTPPPPATCDTLSYVWPDGTAMPYSCDDECHGQRCVTGSTISPECFKGNDCDATTCPDGTCVDTPPDDCAAFCAAASLPTTCSDAEQGQTRLAVNQNGPCHGNLEVCKSSGEWRLADGAFVPDNEACNEVDDDCNGIVDDMFVTCGDPGLCQNTVNTCNPADPSTAVPCVTLAAPSAVEICNNGLDDDCEGSVDDGCECGDEECMPGETWADCPADCPEPANGSPCDDGDLCTSGDTWQNGVCASGTPVTCESDNACVSAGTCNPTTGCSATKVNCDDGVDCTADTCDSVLGCLNTPDDSACSDGDPCTIDTCDAAAGCGHTADPLCAGQDGDGDGWVAAADGGDDCDDNDAAVYPGAAEACNGIDDDCNAVVDDGYGAGGACSGAPNACGDTVPGMKVCTADGAGVQCNAPAAPDPAGYGNVCTSSANACGQTASGTIGCDGSCSATAPEASDGDADGTADCIDACASDPAKVAPGECGCGVADADSNGNGTSDCLETSSADLGIAASLHTRTVVAGKRLRIRWDVTNAGPDRAEPVVLVSGSISGGVVRDLRMPRGCSGTADAFTCELTALSAGRHRSRQFQMVSDAGTTLVFTAAVSSPLVDPNPANRQAVLEVAIP